jgi:hypothetical protein
MKSCLFFLPAASENPAQHNVRSRVVGAISTARRSFSGSVINIVLKEEI